MMNLSLLLLVSSAFSVTHGWYDLKYNVTGEICANSIKILSNSYTPIRVYPVDDKTRDKFTVIKVNMRQKLEALRNSTANVETVQMYYHEFRRLDFAQFPIYCSQEIAYKVAEICNDAVSEATKIATRGDAAKKMPLAHMPRGYLPCPLH